MKLKVTVLAVDRDAVARQRPVNGLTLLAEFRRWCDAWMIPAVVFAARCRSRHGEGGKAHRRVTLMRRQWVGKVWPAVRREAFLQGAVHIGGAAGTHDGGVDGVRHVDLVGSRW